LNERQAIVLPVDKNASDIARRIVGDERRWRELVAVNPHKTRSRFGGFDYLADGEKLWLPLHWPADPKMHLATMPGASSAGGSRFEAGTLPPSTTLPNGWQDEDLKAVIVMASDLGVSDPKSLMYVWASETGNSASQQLNPSTRLDCTFDAACNCYRLGTHGSPCTDPWTPFFAGGLNGSTAAVCRSMGFKSAQEWLGDTPAVLARMVIRVQLQGIYRQYMNHVHALGEGFDKRAWKLNTTTAALIYLFNFLPAYAPGITSATQAIVSAGSPFYDGNVVLDTTRKGYISLRDFEKLTAPNRWPAGWPVYALTARLDALHQDAATMTALGPTGASIWDSINQLWSQYTGNGVHQLPPSVLSDAARDRKDLGLKREGPDTWSAEQYWQATGALLFAGFILLYAHGYIRR
jgi:hypothetical protein